MNLKIPRLTAAILKTTAYWRKVWYIGHISCIFISCYGWEARNLGFCFGGVSRQFSLRILHIVKFQIYQNLEKYLRKIFLADEPYRDWLIYPYLTRFLCVVCFPKSVIPQFLAPEFVNCYVEWISRTGVAKVPSASCFGFAWFLTFCNGNYHCRRSNRE